MRRREKRRRHREASKQVIRGKFKVKIRVVRFNHIGLPRSGKTTFHLRLMGEMESIVKDLEMREELPSTGIAEGEQVLIRSVRSDKGIIQSRVWSVLKSLKEEANMLNQFCYQTASNSPSSAASREELSVSHDSSEGGEVSASGGDSSGDLASHSSEMDEAIFLIEEAMKADDWDKIKYLLKDTILLISTDTGGQAEFLDMQASLVHGPSFNLLYWRLVDQLDSQFKTYYTNEKGVSTEKEDSTVTVEELLFQSLSSIACFGDCFSDGDDTSSKSKTMFVGTYLDKVSMEDFKKKDQLLQKKIKNTEFFNKGIIKFAHEDQLMLAVNNWNGRQAEIDRIRKVLEKVILENFKEIEIPMVWLLLSLILRKKKVRTISLEECEKLAGRLRIDPTELQDALWFLHHHVGVLLYYPELESLKSTVICDIQVLYDSANNLIKNTFTFNKVGKYVSEKFREKALFSLKDVKKAMSGHTDDLIPLEKLVELLEHINILTPIPPTPGDSIQEPTYFMPCVLKSARASELSVHTPSDSDPAPLMLRYDCGYVPVGVFPAMITNLVSQRRKNWEMIEEGLSKNKVQFYVGDDYDTVTLISHPRYFEIAVVRQKDFEMSTESLCAHVRSVVQSTLSTVTSRMNHCFSMGYKFGFECPLHLGRDHLCIVTKETARYMECLKNPKWKRPVPLGLHHRVWFLGKCSPSPAISTSAVFASTGPLPGLCQPDSTPQPDFQSYVLSLPPPARPHLELQLDWDNEGVERDLCEIADNMLDWEEKLSTHLDLTAVNISDIKEVYQNKPVLQRRDALRKWQGNLGIRATYGNLLELFVKAGHTQCAEAVCQVLKGKYAEKTASYRHHASSLSRQFRLET